MTSVALGHRLQVKLGSGRHVRGHLESAHPWVSEPLLAWLGEPWSGSRSFEYHIAGDDIANLVVTRL